MSDLSDIDEQDNNDVMFNKAADYIQNNHQLIDPSNLLEFYGLYKQSTVGNCNTTKPGLFNIQGKAKWNSWNNLKNVDKNNAKLLYIKKLNILKPLWYQNGNIINDTVDKKEKNYWINVSTMSIDNDEIRLEHEKTIFDYVKENQLEKLLNELDKIDKSSINKLDDNGMGLVHWASDRGYLNILQILLEKNADINLNDSEGQTPLHYASSCGHLKCVELLLNAKADTTIQDNNQQTCLDVAFNDEMSQFIQNF